MITAVLNLRNQVHMKWMVSPKSIYVSNIILYTCRTGGEV